MLKLWIRVLWFQVVLIAATIAVCINCLPGEVEIPRIDFILSSLMNCTSTFSGFTLTVVSILLSFTQSAIMQYLIKNGGVRELRTRYTLSLVMGIALIVTLLVIGSMIDESCSLDKATLIFGLCVTISYFMNLISSGWYLLKTLSLVTTVPEVRIDDTPSAPTGEYRI